MELNHADPISIVNSANEKIIPRQSQLELPEFIYSSCISQPSPERQNPSDIQRYIERDLL